MIGEHEKAKAQLVILSERSEPKDLRLLVRWAPHPQKPVVKIEIAAKDIPQGLKPRRYCGSYGTTKVAPFQNRGPKP
jgi:hypothetical protein